LAYISIVDIEKIPTREDFIDHAKSSKHGFDQLGNVRNVDILRRQKNIEILKRDVNE